MSSFFDQNILEEIKKNESPPVQIENFLSLSECENLINYFRNLKNKSVGKSQYIEREESTKIFLNLIKL